MYICAIDLGGTKIALGILNFQGKIITQSTIPTPVAASPQKVILLLVAEIKKMLQKSGLQPKQIRGIGLGVPGQILPEEGLVVSSPNLPKWKNVQIKKPLEKFLKLPVFLDNDANAAALGELYFGSGVGVKNFLYVTISTGIGAGLILDGEIFRGARNIAGEVGHMIILPGGPICGCGNRGCFEALASGNSFARHGREELKKFRGPTILRKMIKNKLKNLDAKILAEAVKKNDPFAKGVWAESATYLGIGLANLVNIFNPELLIIGGGFAKSGSLIFKPIKKMILQLANSVAAQSVRVIPAKLQENSGLLGAGALVMAARKK
jgi:glucokinase